jgi:hypothetical protein
MPSKQLLLVDRKQYALLVEQMGETLLWLSCLVTESLVLTVR